MTEAVDLEPAMKNPEPSPKVSSRSSTASTTRRRASQLPSSALTSAAPFPSSTSTSPPSPMPSPPPMHFIAGTVASSHQIPPEMEKVSAAGETDVTLATSAPPATPAGIKAEAAASDVVQHAQPTNESLTTSTTHNDVFPGEDIPPSCLSSPSSPSSRSSSKRSSLSRGANKLRRSLRSTSNASRGGILGILFPWANREPEEEDQEVCFAMRGRAAPFPASSVALRKLPELFLTQLMESSSAPRDNDGSYIVDRACPQIELILECVSKGKCALPKPTTEAWVELMDDAMYLNVIKLVQTMNKVESNLSAQDRERLRIVRLKVEFARTKAELEAKQMQRRYVYNVLIVGVSGSGKSSSLNTILNAQECLVSGAQAQGTKGTVLRDGVIDDESFLSYVDTQGLGADTNISDTELLSQIMTAAESVRSMGIINVVLLSFDTSTRTTPAMMANQLTLMELFSEIRRSCFLCFTKWNTNSVISEWNVPLNQWIRKWRRVKSIEDIDEDPPSYMTMYEAYSMYLIRTLVNGQDGGAFAKLVTFLSFFESRCVWMFNLDPMQIEDMEDDMLEPHILYMYKFYRAATLEVLRKGSTVVDTSEMIFLKGSKDTMFSVAMTLVKMRNRKITQLELIGLQKEKRGQVRDLFRANVPGILERIGSSNYDCEGNFGNDIATLAGVQGDGAFVGCHMQ